MLIKDGLLDELKGLRLLLVPFERWHMVQHLGIPWCLRSDGHVREGVPFVLREGLLFHVCESVDRTQRNLASFNELDVWTSPVTL